MNLRGEKRNISYLENDEKWEKNENFQEITLNLKRGR